MAKQRRARASAKPKKPARPVRRKPAPRRPSRVATVRPPPPVLPVRSTHQEAVAAYERGLQALQQHDYGRAAELLHIVLEGYPEEKELHERVRLYLNICERQTVPPDSTPRSPEERVYAATVAINAGDYSGGLAHLQELEREAPGNDHVHYMLAVVHTLLGQPQRALPHLQRAIELNPENRFLAFQDADLETLRQDPAFRAALGTATTTRPERKTGARGRTSR